MKDAAVTAHLWSDTLQHNLLSHLLVLEKGKEPTELQTWVAGLLGTQSECQPTMHACTALSNPLAA